MPNGTNVAFFGTPFADDSSTLFTPLGLEGNDILEGDSGDDYLAGLDGIDQIKGESGLDTLLGGAGDDSLFGGIDDDLIEGGDGDDYIEGGSDSDRLFGNAGDDIIWGDNAGNFPELGLDGDDFIDGGAGNDLIQGEGGDDTLLGSVGDDTLFGANGDDEIFGGAGEDLIAGGAGNDTIAGEAGNDTLTGGNGEDVFVFTQANDFTNDYVDIITDFDVNEDRIDLSDFDLGTVTEDALGQNNDANQFAFDDFSNGLSQGLENAFYQIGADVYIDSRAALGYNLGSLGDGSASTVIVENVNIDDLGGRNFIFQDSV